MGWIIAPSANSKSAPFPWGSKGFEGRSEDCPGCAVVCAWLWALGWAEEFARKVRLDFLTLCGRGAGQERGRFQLLFLSSALTIKFVQSCERGIYPGISGDPGTFGGKNADPFVDHQPFALVKGPQRRPRPGVSRRYKVAPYVGPFPWVRLVRPPRGGAPCAAEQHWDEGSAHP